jgi:uncharacterized protein YcbX
VTDVSVTALAITAIKGSRLQIVDVVDLQRTGAAGNRSFYLIDERGRMVNGKEVAKLQAVVAKLDDQEATLRITLPDGHEVSAPVILGETVATRFFSRPRTDQLVDGPFSAALSAALDRPLRLVHTASAVDRGRRGVASLISRGSLRRLADVGGVSDVDQRRFRMLIEVEGLEPHGEDAWVGRRTRIGESLIRWHGHVGRCLVTSRNPQSGDVDLPTLDILGEYRRELDSTEPLPFGIHGEVLQAGEVRVGDPVEFADQ